MTSAAKPPSLLPSAIYNGATQIPYGVYDGLIADTDTAEWDKQGRFFKARRMARKSWIFIGIYSPDFICGMAIADAGFFTNAFAYYYSFKDGTFIEESTLVPMGHSAEFDAGLGSEWRIKNYRISTDADGRMHFEYDGKFKLKTTAALTGSGASIMAPSEGGRPFNFTYKDVCMPVEVTVTQNGKTESIKGNFGAIDYTKGFPPRKTIWNWCSFIGATESGKNIGLNLVKHFNGEVENILWVDSDKTILGSSFFSLTKPYKQKPWRMGTNDKRLDFKLTPSGARSANVNLLFLKSCFIQVFGRIEGIVEINNHQEKFNAYGVAEDHLALW